MRRSKMSWISIFNIGSPQGSSSWLIHKTGRSRAVTSFILLSFLQKRRVHTSIQTNLSQTLPPQDTTIRFLPLYLPLLHCCKHFWHRKLIQAIINHQTQLSTPKHHSSRWYNIYFSRTPQWWHTCMHGHLLSWTHNHQSLQNTNHSVPPFPKWYGMPPTTPLFLTQVVMYKAKSFYYSVHDWTQTIQASKHLSVTISANMLALIPWSVSLILLNDAIFASDGIALISHLLTHLNPSSRKNLILAFLDLTRLEMGLG